MAIRHLVAAVALSVSLAGLRPNDHQHSWEISGGAGDVSYAPGAKDGPHRHAQSAFIMAYVISGAILSQVDGEPAHIYRAGQTWQEDPGAHHVLAENASKTEPARLLAVFVVDTADENALTTFDMKPGDNHE